MDSNIQNFLERRGVIGPRSARFWEPDMFTRGRSRTRSTSEHSSGRDTLEYVEEIEQPGPRRAISRPRSQWTLEEEKTHFGDVYRPRELTPDMRADLFVRSQPMAQEEQDRIKTAFQARLQHPDVTLGEESALAEHLRPSTPPDARARRTWDKYRAAVPEATAADEKVIFDAHTGGEPGMIEALQHWCEGRTEIPIVYANALIRQQDRLKMEFARQMSEQRQLFTERLNELNEEWLAQKPEPSQEEEDLEEMRERVQKVEKKIGELKEQNPALVGMVSQLRFDLANASGEAEREEIFKSFVSAEE